MNTALSSLVPSGVRSSRTLRRTRPAAHDSGFTLPEILLAATLGALLLIATASTAGVFSTELGYLNEEQDTELAEALTAITDDVRYAWWAEVPNSTTLTLADPSGDTTTYFFRLDKLVVQRPSGAQGYLLEGLQSGSFAADTTTRYREGSPSVRGGTFWQVAAPVAAVPSTQLLEAGDKLALGFTPTSPAPVGASLIAGIQEQLVNATPTSISLPIAAIAPVGGTVQLDLFRARAPDDARPEGSSLASVTLAATSLPVTASYVWNTASKKKVTAPKTSPWGWWKTNPLLTLVTTPPATAVSLNITSMNQVVQPGYAYTLQIQLTGIGGIAVATTPAATANNSGVAFEAASGGGMLEQAMGVARTLDGTLDMTQALATTVVNRVNITLVGSDGTEVSGSVTLTGQGMADDNWLGVIPGETEP